MREFRVTLNNRAGELTRLTQLIADRGVNLRSVAGIAEGQRAHICLVATDVTAMRQALDEARMPYQEEEIVSVLVEDGPGQIAEITQKLADANVSLHSIYILARSEPLIEIGLTVDNPKKAKHALDV